MTGIEALLADPAALWPMAVTLLLAGAVIGVLAGLFGVGGGGISVPVFYETFLRTGLAPDVAMPLAVGTSLAMIVPTSIVSARGHHARGAVDMDVVRAWAVPVFLGVVLGTVLARFGTAALFQTVFVLVAGFNAFKLLFSRGPWVLRDSLPPGWPTRAYGGLVGVISALMGIGGGAVSNLILTLHGMTQLRAVATSAAVGVLVAIPGSIGFVLAGWGKPGLPVDALGYVSLLALVLTLPTTLLTTRLGVRLAHALPKQLLGRLFGAFLAVVCLRFLVALV